MIYVLMGLSLIVALASLGCWIYTVVVAFQNEDTIIGVVCLCPLIGFIMGFVKMKEWGHEKVMAVWGVCFAINLVLQVVAGALAPAAL
jgi:FtsH-binding integral membrane protein